jgi:hypothetical protein
MKFFHQLFRLQAIQLKTKQCAKQKPMEQCSSLDLVFLNEYLLNMKKYRNTLTRGLLLFCIASFLLSCKEKNALPAIVLKTKLAKGDTISLTFVLNKDITDSLTIDFGSGKLKSFFPSLESTGLQVQSGNSVIEIKTWSTIRQPVEDSIIKIYSSNNAIMQFGCGLNKIYAIDLSNCLALAKLNVSNNLLEHIDLANNVDIEGLNCLKNKLSNLILDQNIHLAELICTDNKLVELDLTKLENLENIQCQNNSIKEIYISELNRILSLDCSNNQLVNLNTQKCAQLKKLNCTNNYLSKLQFLRINNIEQLQCNNNKIAPDSIPYFYNLSDYYLPQDCDVSAYVEIQAKRFNKTPKMYVVDQSLFIPAIITGTNYDQVSDKLTIDFRCFHPIQIKLGGKNPIDYSMDKIKIRDIWYYLAPDGRVEIRSCYFNETHYLAK